MPSLRRPEIYAARKLRRAMSLPEVLLWKQLKGGAQGVSFRKQHPLGPYTADFYCAPSKLVIEVDGEAHSRGDRPERDGVRDQWLAENGYRVLRIPAKDVLGNMEGVLLAISAEAAPPLHHPSDGPPPRERGGIAR